jgi:tRNA dimethylallyltransferase
LSHDPLLVVILGPTGSGKTALSLRLATGLKGEIVNCDSVALYRDFQIGTAKPTPGEQALVPHHLFGLLEPTSYTTAGDYARRARPLLREIAGRSALPIVVGGTGLYLRALLEGLFLGPERSEELRARLRVRAKQRGSKYLYRLLARMDSEAARRIHSNDTPKLIRAIEVSLARHQPMSEQWKSGRDPLQGFSILRLGLDPERGELYRRISGRVERMFKAGLVNETRELLEKYGPGAPPLGSIGYREVVKLISGELTVNEALAATKQAHRHYAKRQMTWFRREPEVSWLKGFGDDPAIERRARALVEAQLPSAS